MNPIAQYDRLKKESNDAVLLYRIGDFIELFNADAKLGSAVLGLTLTTRDKASTNPTPMAGFPYHQFSAYIKRLVAAGHRFAVCELDDSRKKYQIKND